MPAWQDIYFSYVFSWFLYFFNDQPRSKSNSETTEQIFAKISGFVQLFKGLINPALIGDPLRDVAMATN